MVVLGEIEADAAVEVINVAVSRAAVSLSRLAGSAVQLSVPQLRFLQRDAALEELTCAVPGRMVGVVEQFSGPFAGSALLIFPESNSLRLVQTIVGDRMPLEEIPDMAEEAIIEVGNVLLNSCLAGMANLLKCRIEVTLPHCHCGTGPHLFSQAMRPLDPGDTIILMSIDFLLKERDVRGFILLALDMQAVQQLRVAIGGYIRRVTGQADPHATPRQ